MPRLRARVITRNVPTPSITNYVRTADGDTLMTLPTKAGLASKLLGFNSVGEPVATSMPSVATVTLAEFSNSTTLTAATIDAAIDWVRLAGRSAVGDPGQGLYKRRVGAPSHSAYYTSNAGSVYWELAESVVRPEHLGAVGDGTADDRTAILAWHTACSVMSRPGVATKGANYKITATSSIQVSNIDIDWNGATVSLVGLANLSTGLFYLPAVAATYTKTITVNAQLDSATLTLNNVTSLAVGQYIEVDGTFSGSSQSHMAKILNIVGNVVHLSSPLPFALTTVDTYTITVTTPVISNVKVRNLKVDGSAAVGTSVQGVAFRFINETCEVSNIRVDSLNTANSGGISFQFCYGTKIDNISSFLSGSAGNAAVSMFHCSSTIFSNLNCDGDAGFGFLAQSGSHMQFVAPKVQGSYGRAFKFAGVTNSTVLGGEINLDRNYSTGLAVSVRSQRNTFIGCRVNSYYVGTQGQAVWLSDLVDSDNTFIGLHVSGAYGGAGFNDPIAVWASDIGNRFIGCYVDRPNDILNAGGAVFFNLNNHAMFDPTSGGPIQYLTRYDTSPAGSDILGKTTYQGMDSGGNYTPYFSIFAKIAVPTNGSESGLGIFQVIQAGVVTDVAVVGGTAFFPSTNNTFTLGATANQWSNVYATTYTVGANQVVGARGAAVADATDAASVILRLNELLARLRTHGLIAT
jgi:hypothetical protein